MEKEIEKNNTDSKIIEKDKTQNEPKALKKRCIKCNNLLSENLKA